MSGPIHVDGELRSRDEPHVSALDRGFRYGDAIFETLRVYGGTPYAWDRHMDRLAESAAILSLDHGVAREVLRSRAAETLEANDLEEAYLRIAITRGVQPGTLTPRIDVDATVVIQAEPLPRGGVQGSSVWDGPASCIVARTRRIPDEAIPARVKSHNYLNGVLAAIEARDAGADQAIMLDTEGYLTETATANLFVVVEGEIRTPSVENCPVLPGITRADVLGLASGEGMAVDEGQWPSTIFDRADEVFLTNTTWEVRPVDRVGDREFDVGPVTDRLRGLFAEHIERRCYGSADS